jgi:RNA recognition motif-containing protein
MATEDSRKLFVAGLPESITEDALREIFEATGGSVTDLSLPRDRATGRVRGFGFVTFSSPEEAAAARDSLDGSLQAGRPISVRPFSSEPPRREGGMSRERPEGGASAGPSPGGGAGQEDRTLYVGNLPYDVSQQEVSALFTDNGLPPPARTHLPVGPDGRLRGFGFVTCASADAANQALGTLRNLDVRGRRLMVNIAHPRGERPPGGGAMGGGPRPPRSEGGGGFGGPSEPRYPSEGGGPADASRPVDPRRAKNFGPPAPPGGSGGDWAKKKKGRRGGGGEGGGGAGGGGAGGRRERGGGGRQWGSDPDDD